MQNINADAQQQKFCYSPLLELRVDFGTLKEKLDNFRAKYTSGKQISKEQGETLIKEKEDLLNSILAARLTRAEWQELGIILKSSPCSNPFSLYGEQSYIRSQAAPTGYRLLCNAIELIQEENTPSSTPNLENLLKFNPSLYRRIAFPKLHEILFILESETPEDIQELKGKQDNFFNLTREFLNINLSSNTKNESTSSSHPAIEDNMFLEILLDIYYALQVNTRNILRKNTNNNNNYYIPFTNTQTYDYFIMELKKIFLEKIDLNLKKAAIALAYLNKLPCVSQKVQADDFISHFKWKIEDKLKQCNDINELYDCGKNHFVSPQDFDKLDEAEKAIFKVFFQVIKEKMLEIKESILNTNGEQGLTALRSTFLNIHLLFEQFSQFQVYPSNTNEEYDLIGIYKDRFIDFIKLNNSLVNLTHLNENNLLKIERTKYTTKITYSDTTRNYKNALSYITPQQSSSTSTTSWFGYRSNPTTSSAPQHMHSMTNRNG